MEGLERIKVLASEVKDKAVLKIVEYLLSREDMNEKYLNEEKSLKQMIKFIKSEARKKQEDEIAMIEDEVVYNWAIHYWDESNKTLNLKDDEIVSSKNDKTSKTEEKQSVAKNTKKEKNNVDDNKTNNNNKKKKWAPEGQLTLFDFI